MSSEEFLTAKESVFVMLNLCFEPNQSDTTPDQVKLNQAQANEALNYAQAQGFTQRRQLIKLLKQGEQSNTVQLRQVFADLFDVIDPVTFLTYWGFEDHRKTQLH